MELTIQKKIIYRVGTEKEKEEIYEEAKDVTKALKDASNHWYFKEDTKIEINNNIAKENNETKTAINLSSTNWNNKEVKILLGNNGLTSVHMDIDKINFKVNKIWDDSNNQSGERPKNVIIRLKRNGKDLGDEFKAVLNEENNWSYTYENIPLIIDGVEMTYTIEEERIENYKASIEGSQETGFTITNTLIVENPYTGFKTAITVIVLSLMLTFVCYYFKDKRNKLYKI